MYRMWNFPLKFYTKLKRFTKDYFQCFHDPYLSPTKMKNKQ